MQIRYIDIQTTNDFSSVKLQNKGMLIYNLILEIRLTSAHDVIGAPIIVEVKIMCMLCNQITLLKLRSSEELPAQSPFL